MKDYYTEVRPILINWPATRDNDMLLYAIFLAENRFVSSDETFFRVMSTAKERKIPSYESITRTRRKVQETEPDLCGKKKKARQAEQERYRDYYRNNQGGN